LGRKGSYQNRFLISEKHYTLITEMITQRWDCTVWLRTSRVSNALGQKVFPAITTSIHTQTLGAPHTVSTTPTN